jgi:hypothetical protein
MFLFVLFARMTDVIGRNKCYHPDPAAASDINLAYRKYAKSQANKVLK